jgi:ammonium transporter, Amt family
MQLSSSSPLRPRRLLTGLAVAGFLAAAGSLGASARIPTEATYDAYLDNLVQEYSFFTVSNLWLLIAAAMVFMMHLGFASLEVGLNRAKNAVNILYKNLFVIACGLVTYAVIGFDTMYPAENFNGFLHVGLWFGVHPDSFLDTMTSKSGNNYTYWTDFLFQAMFAATAATIVSGAVAERIKLGSFMVFAVLLVGIAYPIAGSWTWGAGGWLGRNGFTDFAGSSVVHAFGGYAALACVLILGPRHGKYDAAGKARPIPGHSLPLATIGVFLLWFGWFGFNGGSVLDANPEGVARVLVATNLSGAAGIFGAMLTCQLILRKPDLSMALNGALAGLVGITAGADSIEPGWALLVGFLAGALVVVAILLLERLRLDDPVGAISVHGICGTWGTLAVGIWGEGSFLWQLYGCLSYAIFAFLFAFVVFSLIRVTMGVRVSEEEEMTGLDIAEHGQEAYADLTSKA